MPSAAPSVMSEVRGRKEGFFPSPGWCQGQGPGAPASWVWQEDRGVAAWPWRSGSVDRTRFRVVVRSIFNGAGWRLSGGMRDWVSRSCRAEPSRRRGRSMLGGRSREQSTFPTTWRIAALPPPQQNQTHGETKPSAVVRDNAEASISTSGNRTRPCLHRSVDSTPVFTVVTR